MKIANISTIKNKLSEYLQHVKRGETVRIFDRNEPVADLVPIGTSKKTTDDETQALTLLQNKGLLKIGTKKTPKDLVLSTTKEEPSGVLEALLKNRREER